MATSSIDSWSLAPLQQAALPPVSLLTLTQAPGLSRVPTMYMRFFSHSPGGRTTAGETGAGRERACALNKEAGAAHLAKRPLPLETAPAGSL